jgi:hypothetical protein
MMKVGVPDDRVDLILEVSRVVAVAAAAEDGDDVVVLSAIKMANAKLTIKMWTPYGII